MRMHYALCTVPSILSLNHAMASRCRSWYAIKEIMRISRMLLSRFYCTVVHYSSFYVKIVITHPYSSMLELQLSNAKLCWFRKFLNLRFLEVDGWVIRAGSNAEAPEQPCISEANFRSHHKTKEPTVGLKFFWLYLTDLSQIEQCQMWNMTTLTSLFSLSIVWVTLNIWKSVEFDFGIRVRQLNNEWNRKKFWILFWLKELSTKNIPSIVLILMILLRM